MTSRTASQSRWLEGRHASAQIVLGVLVATATIGGMRLIASSDPLLGVVAVLLVVGSLWLAVTRNTAFALAAYMFWQGAKAGFFS